MKKAKTLTAAFETGRRRAVTFNVSHDGFT